MLDVEGNPLLSDEFPIAFERVRAEHVKPAVDELLAEARQRLARVEDEEAPPTFANTMLALEAATLRLERAMRIVSHLESVSTSEALRAAFNEAQPRVSELLSQIPLSAKLWARLKRFAGTAEARGLVGARKRFLDKTLIDFRRHGADLDSASKERLAAIDVELTKLTLRYSQNVLDSTNAFELMIEHEAALAGLPESARNAARADAEAKGVNGWRFSLQAPSYIPLLTYLDDRSVRETVYRAATTRAAAGEHDNRPIVARVLALRREKAVLLGFASFADLVLVDRMAKSGARAREFVADLTERTRAHFEREKSELLAFRHDLEGSGTSGPLGPDASNRATLEPWDLAYYAEKLRKARYDYEEEALRAYFSLPRVLAGLFEIARRLFGVRFEPWDDAPRWHDSVLGYRLMEGDRWIAGVYVDAFPRETKQHGAWMHGIVARARNEAEQRRIGVLVANVTPPVGGGDAQLTHAETETLFHEFGHLMHHCLSRTELVSHAGTSVAWDFVELPSQIFENWCWQREALDLFATHVDSGASIPAELLDAMNAARKFRAASGQMRQLGFSSVDMALHVDFHPTRDGDVVDYARRMLTPFTPTELPPDYAMIASFDHLFGSPVGYAAGYYSYKWAEVLEADAFTRFEREGLLDPAVGGAFRRAVLERGDEEDPEALFRAFMGRGPELGPLLERLGIG